MLRNEESAAFPDLNRPIMDRQVDSLLHLRPLPLAPRSLVSLVPLVP